ncbi:MAG: formylglycine-generating enzyme family protein, partial [Desulfobacterales bacterium]|nr:formylglycine-generating enzyme family protein [Desulfobacterales bacterium]
FDKEKCNTVESKIGHATPVKKYQEGRSPYGCLNMAGNVWEWADSNKKDEKVLRGGSCGIDRVYARCARCIWFLPVVKFRGSGFRCAWTLK